VGGRSLKYGGDTVKEDLEDGWSEITVVLGRKSPNQTTTYRQSIECVYMADTDEARMAYNNDEQRMGAA
jgi:hypothetical protein